jgi:hypothetical protein
MGTAAEMAHIAGASLLLKARIAGVFWLMTILAGASALVFVNDRPVANLIATSCYVVATLLVYDLLKPVNRSLSLLAAFFSLVGCAVAILNTLHLATFQINSLVFFGLHCLLVGYLIFRSTFLPRILGVLMAFGGLGWLTFLSQPLVNYLSPYNLAPGILGELSLTLWLLVKGVNVEKWKAQAEAQLSERASHNV